ncbi:MAG TPA: hypothetical protein VJT15_04985 [Pyrinomonadaceae bacterium]|nr:hypothetical protein [Pyrinomonadaceae bacterium]
MSTYETKSTHPGTLPNATIYMGGLLCLSFDGARKCTVGVNQVGGGHTWKFWIVEQGADERFLDLKHANVREIHIDVTGGAMGGSYVFNGDRISLGTNKRRFNLESSWIDLEGSRGHDQPIENNPNTLWPRFYINEGLFCASKLSTRLFTLRNSKPTPVIKQLGPVALEMVADVFLDTSDPRRKIEIKLSYDTARKTMSLDKNKRYQIYILNDCDSVGPYYFDDFPLHYKSFSNAFDRCPGKLKVDDQFHLVANNASVKSEPESLLAQTGDAIDSASDRAPCMGIALGQTKEFKA